MTGAALHRKRAMPTTGDEGSPGTGAVGPGVTRMHYFNGPVSLYCQKPGEPDVLVPVPPAKASLEPPVATPAAPEKS